MARRRQRGHQRSKPAVLPGPAGVSGPQVWFRPNPLGTSPFLPSFTDCDSFAMVEINLIIARLFWRFDMELVDPELDWEGSSSMHVMWRKPDLGVRFQERKAR